MSSGNPHPEGVRSYGAAKLSSTAADWGCVRSTLLRRERASDVVQRFRLPFHVFRVGVSGSFDRGSTTSFDGGRPEALHNRPGAITFYPAGTEIVNQVSRASRLTYATVEIEPTLVDALLHGRSPSRPIYPVLDLNSDVARAVLQSLLPDNARSNAESLFSEQAALLLMLTVGRSQSLMSVSASPLKGGLAPQQLERITDYLRDNIANRVTLGELAQVAGLSPTHICRAFKQSLGRTPHGWLHEARIAEAQRLLAATRMPVAEISLAVGFSGQAQFTTAFRRRTGWTPARWRAYRRS